MIRKLFVGDFQINQEERDAINEVLDKGRLSEGPKVREFEVRFARYVGTKYCIATSSGTGALLAGLTALTYYQNHRIKKGTKVITSPVTYVATTNAIVVTGFEPVFVDIDPQTFALLPDKIEELLRESPDPREYALILPVHLMGYPCDMDRINEIAERYGLLTFEDSAQAHGTLYKGRKTGSLSILSVFSFYMAHNIQAGEMGAITTNDPEIARLSKKIKANGRLCDCPLCMRSQGKCPRKPGEDDEEDPDPRFTHDVIGYNFKTMEFQAALGLTQLRKVDWILQKRRDNVYYLNQRLKRYSDLFRLPLYSEDISYLAYPLIIKDPKAISKRYLRGKLEEHGVETRPLFGCIPTQQPAYAHLKDIYAGKLPNANFVGSHGFYIGCHQYLKKDDLDYVVEVFEEILG